MTRESTNISKEALVTELTKHEDSVANLDPNEEADYLTELLNINSEVRKKLQDYSDLSVAGVGGSGIVFSATYGPFGTRRAIKLPRKRLYMGQDDSAEQPKIDPEVHALSKVSHQNITRLYESFPLPGGTGHCMITEYVNGAQPLDDFAFGLCCNDECRKSDFALNAGLKRLSLAIYQVIDAFHYMHDTARLIHFDVKPDNILVSDSAIPYVTDLGFARDIDRHKKDEAIEVGFTWKYAHPDLTDPHRGARVSQTAAKSRNIISGDQLHPRIDLYSFGRTLQEVLKRMHDEYGEGIHSNYVFNYLHVLACLCLDGRNASETSASPGESFVSDSALGMPSALFAGNKFEHFSAVQECLQRLLGMRRLEDDLPEVDRWSPGTIKVSDLGTTSLTNRVAAIINHPAVQRLKSERQLGMMDTIFPTATHNRFQHSLGTYHAAREYISALYFDPDNPIFRALFSPEKCKRLLLASLVHDLGQTTFGHELEEVDKEEFSHTNLIHTVASSKSFKDQEGRTLKDLIEGSTYDCWNDRLISVLNLIQNKYESSIDGILCDILDSHIDADKFDYLLRDSVECRVHYGLGIDYERFLRSLTTHAVFDGSKAFLRLAIKQKGAASAEAFAYARYQLYQSLYWHHTFRVTKAMLIEAVGRITNDFRTERDTELFDRHPLRTAYLRHVIGVHDSPADVESGASKGTSHKGGKKQKKPLAKTTPKVESISQALKERLSDIAVPEISTSSARNPGLLFFWKLSSKKSRLLIEDLMTRNYYKRIFELSAGDLSEHNWQALRDRFTSSRRQDTQNRVEKALTNILRTKIQSEMNVRASLALDSTLERFEAIASQKIIFVVDVPIRGWFASGDEPIFVSDFKRRHFRSQIGRSTPTATRSLWTDELASMYRRIAYFRVFCEPQVHKILVRVTTADDIFKALRDALPEIPRTQA